MAPKRSTKTKAGMAQPTISFQHRKPGTTSNKKSLSSSSLTKSTPTLDLSDPTDLTSFNSESVGKVGRAQIVPEISGQTTKGPKTVVGGKKELNVKDKKWAGVIKAAEVEMGGMKPSPETHNDIHPAYGPCVGITRLQRWERAKKWGLNPPDEIKEILITRQGEDEPDYRENVLHTWLG